MARANVTSKADRRAAYEPLYDVDRQTGATLEVFYADGALADSMGTGGAGWFWWTCQAGSLPGEPTGPFVTSYIAYRNVGRLKVVSCVPVASFGRRVGYAVQGADVFAHVRRHPTNC
jgi:hypothetical protein